MKKNPLPPKAKKQTNGHISETLFHRFLFDAQHSRFEEQFDQIEQMYGETDFDCFALKTQLTTVKTLFIDNTDICLQNIVNKFKTLSQGQLMLEDIRFSDDGVLAFF